MEKILLLTAANFRGDYRGPEARQLLEEVLSWLDAVTGPRPTHAEITAIRLTRFEQHWSRTVAVAALLAEGRFVDPTFAGRSDAFGMLFPLHHLFERAMRGVLSRAARPLGLTVEHKSNALHMLRDSDDMGHLRVRPDFVFFQEGHRLMIGDTKWKRMSEGLRAGGADREDVFQMNAYLTRYEVERAVIFVPKTRWMAGGWRRDFTIPPGIWRLSLLSVDIQRILSRQTATSEAAMQSLRQSIAELAGLALAPDPAQAGDLLAPSGP